MSSFGPHYLDSLVIPGRLIQAVRRIGEAKGKQALWQLRQPERLNSLRERAIIQSVESSNRIEGVVASRIRLQALVKETTKPKNRSEAEIAGYRYVLGLIHDTAMDMQPTPNVIRQLHRDLMRHGTGGGHWKVTQNEIEERRPDGTTFVRFTPTPPHLTAEAMANLHQRYSASFDDDRYEPLITAALYILDFLCVHPFADGNGRMSRLLTTLLLYRLEYDVVRYISLERIIEHTKESYYSTLKHASEGWHDGKHDPVPWIDYWLGVIIAAYRELEEDVTAISQAANPKSLQVMKAINQAIGAFSVSHLEEVCAGISRTQIKNTLKTLQQQGKVELIGKGRTARWRKITS